MPQELTGSTFADAIKSGVALVDFWAPWCGPCRMLGPVIEEVSHDFEGKALVAKVNTDDESELADQQGIARYPTVLFFKDGQKVEELVGVRPKSAYTEVLNRLLAPK